MRDVVATRSPLALAAVLVAYWIPAILALRWVMWIGGDPNDLGLVLEQQYWRDWLSLPYAPHGMVVIPVLITATAASVWGLIRQRHAGVSGVDPWLLAGALLGVPTLWFMMQGPMLSLMCSIWDCWPPL